MTAKLHQSGFLVYSIKISRYLSILLLMQLVSSPIPKSATDSSNNKSSRPTLRMTNSPLPINEESSVLSLNFEDLKELMKRKERQFQNDLQVADAKRVHGFLSELQAQQRQKAKTAAMNERRRLKQATEQYNNEAFIRCQAEWKANLEQTLNQLQQIGRIADEQQEREMQQANKRLEDAKNGKGLEKAKFSKTVLEMQSQLARLVKAQRYQEAEVVNTMLQQRKNQQVKQLLLSSVDRERKAIDQLKKKHNAEKETLSQRLAQVYQVQQARRDQSIDKLVKNIRTYEIDPNKLTFSVQRQLRGAQSARRRHSVSVFEALPTNNKERAIENL